MSILLEPVTTQNGWNLIKYNNMLAIKKDNYYYSTNSHYHFKGRPIDIYDNNLIYLGEYKSVMCDTNYFRSLPIVVNNHSFFVNTLTNIVYIKSKEIIIIIPGSIPYNNELYATFTFAGVYNPYMNSIGTSGKSFISMIPQAPANKIAKVEINPTKYTSPIENTLTENPYPTKNMNIPGNITILNGNVITFIIPFLSTKNVNSLINTIKSIIDKVNNYRIIVVNSDYNLVLPENIKERVMLLPYTRYVGRLGYENRLNVIMGNTYDMASFYNYLITNYVKTYIYTIWNYNWQIESWPVSITSNKTFMVPNYYNYNNNIYKSLNSGKSGYILSNKSKYNTTNDMFDIIVNGLGIRDIDNNIKIKGNYNELDLYEREGLLLYGNESEIRDFYIKMKDEIKVEYVEKII
jgi:hypothetical protein